MAKKTLATVIVEVLTAIGISSGFQTSAHPAQGRDGADSGRPRARQCSLVVDTSTPNCGNSRFGCWVWDHSSARGTLLVCRAVQRCQLRCDDADWIRSVKLLNRRDTGFADVEFPESRHRAER